MSLDLVALVGDRPDFGSVLGQLQYEVRAEAGGAQIYHPSGQLLVWISEPLFVQVPGEVRRLLGVDVPPPVWWVEVRAAADLAEGDQIARWFTQELARRHGGNVWTGGGY